MVLVIDRVVSAVARSVGAPQVRKLYKSSAVAWVTAASADGKSLDPQTTLAALRPVILLLLLSALYAETFAENAVCILRSLHTFVLEDMTFTPGLAGTIAGILGDKARSASRHMQSRIVGSLTGRRARRAVVVAVAVMA